MKKEKFQLHGKAFVMLRLDFGMKSIEVARALNLTRGYISLIESNQRKLSEKKTKEFLAVIGVSEEDGKAFFEIVGE